MRGPGEVLLISCYDLGRQPVAVATALAELEREGFSPAALDVAVEPLDEEALRRARLVAISVPMHTALRIGTRVGERVRAVNPSAHVCLFGLYAALNQAHLLGRHCDSVIGGEADEPLLGLARALEQDVSRLPPIEGVATACRPQGAVLRQRLRPARPPARQGLPALHRYARLVVGAESRLVASVEATRGCLHLCRHCPVVPVYRGRFFAVPRETVLADIEQQVAQGARHVTFGDPDFLNGPTHALRIARELHERFPSVTFDATIKIEHLLRHRALLSELARTGCLFITSAVESLNDDVLRALDKGHCAKDVPVALRLVRAAGIDLRPTLLPYSPWARLADLPALFDFAVEHDLVDQVEPVQYTLRLLIPPGSAVLGAPGGKPWLGTLEEERFGYAWRHPDSRVDALWEASSGLAREHAEQGRKPRETFAALRALADAAVERTASALRAPLAPARQVPRLSEPWFC